MGKIAVYLLLGVAAGFALALLSEQGGDDGSLSSPLPAGADVERRLAHLEAALAEEQRERQALATTLARLEQLAAASAASAAEPAAAAEPEPDSRRTAFASGDEPGSGFEPRRQFAGPGADPAALTERFVAAGLSAERAEFIQQRVEALRLEALQARYDAARDGSGASGRPPVLDVDRTLRAELGDADYEKYLTALGRPTDVRVSSVLASSPAAQAGFRDGDRIVGYAGERVFAMNELTELTFGGAPGETVAVDVIRDGQPIQLYLPRGPLGITGGGPRFGRGR